jgi:sugar lactone lactonase YvrE
VVADDRWLPDGRLLVTEDKLRRQEPDGSIAVRAGQRANEIVVDGRGNIYLNGADFDFVARAPPKPGYVKLVTQTASYARSPATSSSPTAWSSRPDDRTLITSESFPGRLTALA